MALRKARSSLNGLIVLTMDSAEPPVELHNKLTDLCGNVVLSQGTDNRWYLGVPMDSPGAGEALALFFRTDPVLARVLKRDTEEQ